jgi:hypothetical protein
MTDPVVFVLRQHRQTLRALLEDMKLARKWGHRRELSEMARFLMKLLRELPDLYEWAAKHVPSGIYNNPNMNGGLEK